MKVRVLVEQRIHLGLERPRLASGEIVDIDATWAKELLDRGDAEPVAVKPAKRAESRESKATRESR